MQASVSNGEASAVRAPEERVPPESAGADVIGILDTIDVPLIVVSTECKITRFNQAATEALGIKPSDIGRLPCTIRALSELKQLEKLCVEVMDDAAPCQCDLRNGDRWFHLRIAPYSGKAGRMGGAVLTFTNVTAFRASIGQAIYEREYTKTILNTVIEPLVVLDADLRVQTANRAFYVLFGVSREASQRVPLSDLGEADWKGSGLWSALQAALSDNRQFQTIEIERDFPVFGRRTVLLDARPLFQNGPPAKLILLAFQDITERKQAEQKLQDSERWSRELVEALPAAVYTTNAEGRITMFNQAAVEFSGRMPELGIESWCISWKLYWPDGTFLPHDQCPMAIALKEDRAVHGCEAIAERPDGTRINFIAYPTPLHDSSGKLVGGVNMLVDITERKRAEDTLRKAKDQLANQAAELESTVAERTASLRETVGELEAFSYSIAHDMRAPLRGMQGLASILSEEHASQLDPQALDYLRRITTSARRLDRLIQDVLNYSKILKAQVAVEPLDLDRFMRDIINAYPGWQPPKACLQIEGFLPKVLANEAFLTQCVSNLLSNAVKFVSTGTIPHIRIWAEEISASVAQPINPSNQSNPGLVRLYFQDNGIGIAPEKHARIFRMFERIHPAAEYEGTGIGLTIARKATERMGAEIGFESALGKGSKFWIQLKTG